eukprot:CAMPEP_0206496056 /NCGR_PEP_ID=MMETSP0324_2-20121206/49095_1 /ASSEMBLY_ACC=CAM_ASM_000836 /TAXON_ID=2866 /ORGANISM="Crypthecodinium cohnii, Strain Seligo" /LENGTH=86 /DNA_ID=CAMNT_0053980827 /DNA_START=75 /DNA_END=335 /DNA_ORIENTATION=-
MNPVCPVAFPHPHRAAAAATIVVSLPMLESRAEAAAVRFGRCISTILLAAIMSVVTVMSVRNINIAIVTSFAAEVEARHSECLHRA